MSIQSNPEAIQQIFQLMTGHIVSTAVNVVAQLGIADRLADGPRTTADLARQCEVNEDALYRVLRALSSLGVFAEESPRTFGLTPAAAALQDGPVRKLALWIANPFALRVYSNAMHSVKTGEPAVPVTVGKGVFEHFGTDSELSKVFNDAMTGFSTTLMPAVLEAYDFSGINTLVDIAGGHGAVLSAILKKYSSMKGILFDLDHVIAGANARLEAEGVADRVKTATGDFFKAVPAGGDAYLMKHIIHDWDDDKATVILKNIRAVLPASGRVLLLESVIPVGNEPGFGKILDLEMLVMPGGRERTEEEFRRLFRGAGFELSRIVPTQSPLSVVEARPGR
jgi:O-methyltransferase/methyltransferase family protein